MPDRKKVYAARKKFQEESLAWTDKMLATYQIMPLEDKQAFDEWERVYADGSGVLGSDDWPGWEKYIGKRPEPPSAPPKNYPFLDSPSHSVP